MVRRERKVGGAPFSLGFFVGATLTLPAPSSTASPQITSTLFFLSSAEMAVASGDAFSAARWRPLRVATASRSSSTVASASFFVPSFTGKRSEAKSIGVRLGLTDGSMTEIVSDEIKEGSEVIVGQQTANTAKPAGMPGPRLF